MMMHAREKVMALVDGELEPAEAPAVVQALAQSPALVRDLQVFLAMTRQRVGGPFAMVAREPAPQHLVDLLLYGPIGQPHGDRETVLAKLRAAAESMKQRWRTAPAWSVAAGPALAGAAVAAFAWIMLPASSVGGHAEFADLLNATPSGSRATVTATIEPKLTFKHRNGSLCRQYDAIYGTRQVSYGVACRDASGDWRVAIATPPTATGKYGTATPEARKAVDDFVTENSVQDYNDRESESGALEMQPRGR